MRQYLAFVALVVAVPLVVELESGNFGAPDIHIHDSAEAVLAVAGNHSRSAPVPVALHPLEEVGAYVPEPVDAHRPDRLLHKAAAPMWVHLSETPAPVPVVLALGSSSHSVQG